jgi:hypothetical protein
MNFKIILRQKLRVSAGAKTVLKGKCTDGKENAQTLEKNAQIVFLLRIETTEGKMHTLRKMHRLHIYLELRPQTERKMHRLCEKCTDCIFTSN